jgi:tRNA dimethylallyltransferase
MDLVQRLPLAIISVDSAMVYRAMDIGTGKPSADELARAPHGLIDIRDPDEPYCAADFAEDARNEIAVAHRKGRVPLLVGGTGLYFRSLRDGLAPLPGANPRIRARLEREAQALGWRSLHARLSQIDPASAARIHPNDPQRIQRALEVYESAGVPMSTLLARDRGATPGPAMHAFIIEPADRARLHGVIARRFHHMLAAGLVDEVRDLHRRWPLSPSLPSMRAVGYRQVSEFLHGGGDYDAMVERAITATRQLARRQLTWLRAQSDPERFDCQAEDLVGTLSGRIGAILDS